MVVVITGASRGIGRAISEKLASQGYDLALCARSPSPLTDLHASLALSYPSLKFFSKSFDLVDRSAIDQFAQGVLEFFGRVDVLINNAGIFQPGSILNETPDIYDRVMRTNVDGPFFMTKAFLPHMIEARAGQIINMCSVSSIQAHRHNVSYTISKHALHGFGKSLREEVREYGIRVTNILPGATWTDSWAGVQLPADRLMEATNIAEVVTTAIQLDKNSVMEDVIIRPALGDLP
ncbi:MAG TPA: SDR family oxidoreductase [Membranihabitans sp.]|nr:SDR family oxidoreductase [Membranihabitans sp.]